MKIRTDIIERINGRPDLKRELTTALAVHRMSVNRYLRLNKHENKLTTAIALQIIAKSLNVDQNEITEN